MEMLEKEIGVSRFNRYIVECKCRKVNIWFNYSLDLIDT